MSREREYLQLANELMAVLDQFKPIDALGRRRIERAKTMFAVVIRGDEIEPGEIVCVTCGTNLGWEKGFEQPERGAA